MQRLPDTGFGLAKIKAEGEIADPDEYTWEHDPFSGGCEKCTSRYKQWRAAYQEQEAEKEQRRAKKT